MKRIAITFILGAALPALADRVPLPANAPASYQAECGSCHMAYQPALLSANDWRRTMAGLKDHFGNDAAVNSPAGQEIASFLERNAGNASKLGSAGEPPRIARPRASSASTAKFQRNTGRTRVSNRWPIAKPVIAVPPRATTASTTFSFRNCGGRPCKKYSSGTGQFASATG